VPGIEAVFFVEAVRNFMRDMETVNLFAVFDVSKGMI
jgi:hypothetical protein